MWSVKWDGFYGLGHEGFQLAVRSVLVEYVLAHRAMFPNQAVLEAWRRRWAQKWLWLL